MVNEPGLLRVVEEEDQQEELFELEGLDSCLVPRPVTVGHGGVGMSCSDVRVVEEPGRESGLVIGTRSERTISFPPFYQVISP